MEEEYKSKATNVKKKFLVTKKEAQEFTQLKPHLGHNLVRLENKFAKLSGVRTLNDSDYIYCVECEKTIEGLEPTD